MRHLSFLILLGIVPALAQAQWAGYGHDPQHTATSTVASQSLSSIHWQTPIDTTSGIASGMGPLFAHYGSPIVTAANTVIVPVKTSASGAFQVQAFRSNSSTPVYALTSDYTVPSNNGGWFPSYGPVLAIRNRVYYPGAGGSVYYRDSVDSPTGASGQLFFYGKALYTANPTGYNSAVQICTPITTDRYGTIYFGFEANSAPGGLTSGIARIALTGVSSWVPVSSFGLTDSAITQPALNAAPALSVDEKTLYVVAATSGGGEGYLVALSSSTLGSTNPPANPTSVLLLDPQGGDGQVIPESTASPMVGLDGDVYMGVLENGWPAYHNDRGWMLHYDSTLTHTKIPGSFGWDNTAAVVPSSAVPGYAGTSAYLILTKYNNYVGIGTGDGVNRLAVLDPNASMTDEYYNPAVMSGPATVMREVITIVGVTADPHNGFPNAVREWCINTAAIDPYTKSALVNSEDGWLYRWDFTTNTFTQKKNLTGGRSEAYTPTAIGIDGTVYAINDTVLFAVGN